MFRSSRKGFQIYYFISSLLPIYLFIIIFMLSIKFKGSKEQITNFYKINSNYKLVFYIFIFLFFVSVCCLFKVKRIIDETKRYSKTLGATSVLFKNKYNPGFREFILSVILPMMSTFSVDDYPFSTLIMVIFFQLFLFIFFLNSSDFFPNLSLFLFGYSVFIVDKTQKSDSKLEYAFGKTRDIDSITNKKQQFKVIEIGEPDFSNNIGVIYE